MSSYLTGAISTKNTPQSQPIPGQESRMQENQAGGFVYAIDKWSQLQRFLILGTEGNTYYASQREQTGQNLDNLHACITEDGLRTVRVICDVSTAGRAPKNDPAILALAVASTFGDEATRKAAYDMLPLICRTGTHLFMWAEFRKELGGFGRGAHRALGSWYTGKDADKLAYQLVKYRQRGGWTHRDILRKIKLRGDDLDPQVNDLLRWVTKMATHGDMSIETLRELVFKRSHNVPLVIEGFEKISAPNVDAKTAAKLIVEYELPREAVPTELLNSNEVWDALLPDMPLTALIRNLATMTRNGLLTPTSSQTQLVIKKLADGEHLRKSRVHPIQVLMAQKTYAYGQSLRGSGSWTAIPQIIDALDDAFYEAFGNVQATGKRRMIALDISGSMWGGSVAGIPGFTPAEAAGAMSMVSVKSGDPYEVVAFTSGNLNRSWGGRNVPSNELIPGLSPVTLSARQRLDDVGHTMRRLSQYMGGTDAALPCQYATKAEREVDVFEVYTDNETWAGSQHPSQALQAYRKASGINAKLVSIGLTATSSSIADPNDAGMLDVVGFDTAAPSLISAFAEGGF